MLQPAARKCETRKTLVVSPRQRPFQSGCEVKHFAESSACLRHQGVIEGRKWPIEESPVVKRAYLVDQKVGISMQPFPRRYTHAQRRGIVHQVRGQWYYDGRRMARRYERLRLDNQYRTVFPRFGSRLRAQAREPDLAPPSHRCRVQSRQTAHSPACFPCGPAVQHLSSSGLGRVPLPRDSSFRSRVEYTPRGVGPSPWHIGLPFSKLLRIF